MIKMKKITSTDLIVYICLIISSIIAPILMHFLNLDENNMVLGLSTIAAGFAYFGTYDNLTIRFKSFNCQRNWTIFIHIFNNQFYDYCFKFRVWILCSA